MSCLLEVPLSRQGALHEQQRAKDQDELQGRISDN